MASPSSPDTKVLWLARLEYRFHSWREKRARARGQRPTVAAFPGYGSTEWVRVLGRVLIPPKAKRRERGDYAGVRGWRSFAAVPIAHATVTVVIDGVSHEVTADRGGVIDAVLPATLSAGWQTITMSVEKADPVDARVFIVGDDIRFGVISDVDDTVMVTALPRPFVAAWNSFVLNEHGTPSSSMSTPASPSPGWLSCSSGLRARTPGRPSCTCRPGRGTSLRRWSGSSVGISSRSGPCS